MWHQIILPNIVWAETWERSTSIPILFISLKLSRVISSNGMRYSGPDRTEWSADQTVNAWLFYLIMSFPKSESPFPDSSLPDWVAHACNELHTRFVAWELCHMRLMMLTWCETHARHLCNTFVTLASFIPVSQVWVRVMYLTPRS